MHFLYTVLAVDDDRAVLDVIAKILAEPGYTVLTASDGYEAIRHLAERHIDLMLTDIRMPGLNGMDLGSQAKLMRPRLHVVYITAFAEESGKARGRVLRKPIRAAALVETVREELTAA
jgi:CheY-like chemotaxis protein